MITDPIADYLTRLRNAIRAGKKVVEIPASNLKREITKILFEQGYILNYKFEGEGPSQSIKIALKYDKLTRQCAITHLERISSPVCVSMPVPMSCPACSAVWASPSFPLPKAS